MKHLLPAFAFLPLLANAQNDCTHATPITPGIHSAPVVAGVPPTNICVGAVAGSAGLWYSYTSSVDTAVTLSTHVEGYPDQDTRVHVYMGTCGALVCLAGDDDAGSGNSSIVSFSVEAGTTYYIVFDSYWSTAAFHFEVMEVDLPDPPAGMVSWSSTLINGGGNIMGVVDMNNDGLDDAVAPGYTSFSVAHQQAGGGFVITSYPTTAAVNQASWSFAIGDWDSNGHRDLLYGGGSGATFMKADATGTAYTQVTFPQYIFCQRTNFVDINNDGHLDAFSCHDVDANVAFLNDGNGNLSFNQGGYGTTCGNYGSIWTDMTNDGVMDLFVAKCGCDPQDLLMTNNGSGVCTNLAPSLGLNDSHQSWSSAWGDFDNDGDMDAFVGSSGGGVHKLLRNNNDGTFTNVTAGSGMDNFGGSSIEWTTHDFNNDGWLDILGGGALHYNSGNMTFTHDATAPGNNAIGDLNNDGFLDIIGGGAGYMRNSGNDHNWIKIIPVGVASNRDAIGARITITSALGTQIREVRSGDGFRYMSYLGAYFGLGTDDAVQQIHIKWPSGAEDVIEGPAINTTHMITEGFSTGLVGMSMDALGASPNPATDVLSVSDVAPNAFVEVFDATGKPVLATRLQGGRLLLGDLSPGVHQLRAVEAGVVRQVRFIKQ